ncbi:hypothetical protein SAMN05216383_1052 [Prevotella sp. KH2C16]|nr:hypothetical protein SAMN05216383_1052 [Prevotella sp. KH2C16]
MTLTQFNLHYQSGIKKIIIGSHHCTLFVFNFFVNI